MENISVGLVQINNSFSGQNYLPYSVGIIQAYCNKYIDSKKNKDVFKFLLPIYKRIPINVAEQKLSSANIIFFSIYTWNINISLEIAKRIKQKNLDTMIIFGGPEVPNESNEFLRKYSFIDIACHGEGEKTALSILDNYIVADHTVRNLKDIPSISYIDDKGTFCQTLRKSIHDLDEIPSPYTDGIFEPLINADPNEKWIALLETNRGCPFSCSYCVWGMYTKKKVYPRNIEDIYREIDWFSQHKIEFVFCCDANFGILKRDIDIVKYIAENKRKYGYPKAFSVQNTKNSTMRIYNIYKLMSDAGLSKGVSLALQSVNRDTLKNIKRENISIDTFHELQRKFNEEHIQTFTDMIIGLPCETYDTFANGISMVIDNGQHSKIQFINLSILTNSEMDNIQYQKKYEFDIVETKLINIHGTLDIEEINETQRLVIGTKSMPKKDWTKTRVFGWMTSLLHFNKFLQIPFIILHAQYNINYRELIEIFMDNISDEFPILRKIISFFINKAKDIQNGGAEFCESKKWLNVWWTADELVMIKLCTDNRLSEFYKEAEQLMTNFLEQKNVRCPILHDAFILNQNLVKMPFNNKDINTKLNYNVWEIYVAGLNNKTAKIIKGEYRYIIDRTRVIWSSWDDWCRYVIWYGNKKGDYLYMCRKDI